MLQKYMVFGNVDDLSDTEQRTCISADQCPWRVLKMNKIFKVLLCVVIIAAVLSAVAFACYKSVKPYDADDFIGLPPNKFRSGTAGLIFAVLGIQRQDAIVRVDSQSNQNALVFLEQIPRNIS